MDASETERVAEGADYEVLRGKRGAFEILRIKGRSTTPLLSWLRKELLRHTRNVAVDLGALSDVSLPLIRELVLAGRRFRNSGRYLVLLHIPGPLRELVRSSAREGSVEPAASERLLDGEIRGFGRRLAEAKRRLTLIGSEMENNPAWSLADREGCWMCPYCARIQDYLRIGAPRSIPDVQIEMVYIHLTEACESYASEVGPRPMAALVDSLARINRDKIGASRKTATALASRVAELQREAQELEESVKVAGERQRHLLPADAPEIPGIVAALGYWPSQRLSGDFFDFIDVGGGRFGILIGDVSGHGIEAGVLMGVAKKVISIRLRDGGDPILALQMANRDIYPDLDRMTFVSAFLGVYDPATRELVYGRAGHNPPVVYNPNRRPSFAKLEAPGLVLGLDPGPRFNHLLRREVMVLEPGDRLFLYTDGVVETQNPQGEEFELSRVYEQLRSRADGAPREIIQLLRDQILQFRQGSPQEDDVTAILFQVM